jgi:hypothetical protein
MTTRIRFGALLLLIGSSGCAGAAAKSEAPVEPSIAAAMTAHLEALHRGDWRAAFEQIHPDLKAKGLTLKRFTDLHARRDAKMPRLDIRIAGSDRTGEDVTVRFNLLMFPPEGGEPVATPPTRRVTLRRAGDSWRLLTNDLLALMP